MKKIFIAAPISGFEDKAEYVRFREFILQLIQKLRSENLEVCSEIEQISKTGDYDSPIKSVKDDFTNIQSSDIFLMLHPKKMQTSSLIELGFACAKSKEIVLAGDVCDFPYLAKGLKDSEIRTVFVEVHNFASGDIGKIVNAIKGII